MDSKGIKTLITFAVLLILGAVLIAVIADQTLLNTQKTTASTETTNLTTSCYDTGQVDETSADCNITVTYAPTGWEQEDSDCYLSSVVVSNASGTALTLDTDYNLFASTGIVKMLNTTDTNSTNLGENVLIDYQYCGDGYMAESWGRSVLNVNVGLFAVILLLAGAALIYYFFGRENYA